MIDPRWIGRVTFYELIFGTFLSYFFLILIWEKLLKTQLEEWKYIIITFLGASFFLVNHYFHSRFAHFFWRSEKLPSAFSIVCSQK